jgi:hypothetical protein
MENTPCVFLFPCLRSQGWVLAAYYPLPACQLRALISESRSLNASNDHFPLNV